MFFQQRTIEEPPVSVSNVISSERRRRSISDSERYQRQLAEKEQLERRLSESEKRRASISDQRKPSDTSVPAAKLSSNSASAVARVTQLRYQAPKGPESRFYLNFFFDQIYVNITIYF